MKTNKEDALPFLPFAQNELAAFFEMKKRERRGENIFNILVNMKTWPSLVRYCAEISEITESQKKNLAYPQRFKVTSNTLPTQRYIYLPGQTKSAESKCTKKGAVFNLVPPGSSVHGRLKKAYHSQLDTDVPRVKKI